MLHLYVIKEMQIKVKMKEFYTPIIHLLEWPKFGILTISNATKNLEQELSSVAGGNANGTTILEDILVVSDKTKHILIILTNALLGIYSSELENLYPHKNLHIDIYSSFIHNCPNLGAIKMFFSR